MSKYRLLFLAEYRDLPALPRKQRWQSIPSRSIWLEIGSRLIEPSKGLGSKYRASNRTEPAFVHHRAESNLQLKCSMLDQAARSGSVILSEEYDTLLSCWADRNTVTRETLIQLLVSRNPRYSIVTCFSFVRLIVCNKPHYNNVTW